MDMICLIKHVKSNTALLRQYIRGVLAESGWDDPDVVFAIAQHEDECDDDNCDDCTDCNDDDDKPTSQKKLTKSVEQNFELQKRDNFSRANTGLASAKPLAPKNTGGPQSGRSPGGTRTSSVSRQYSAGY
jgi:hypothetical protein